MKALDSAKRLALSKAITYLAADPETNIPKFMGLIDKYVPKDIFPSQRIAFKAAIEERNNWYELILKVMDINPEVRDRLLKTFLVDANFMAWPIQEQTRLKEGCNIPWTILMDPTSACNMHCKGCWAAEYGHHQNLSYEELDSIIRQGKELGTYVYMYTGGEPLMRKKDLIKLCEAHPDCAFLCFTNSTLIDDDFCKEMVRVANFVPAISVEGFESATDGRRGDGTFQKVSDAMDLLKSYGLPFGVSTCYTSENAESIASEEFFDWMIDKGVLFCWFFTFMPVGVNSTSDLIPSAEQREHLYHFIREMRETKPLFTLDFWGDAEYVGGCVAGGRRFLHINAAGDVEPCVFAHYSNANIREVSLLDALKSPLFMAYRENQPWNDNLLRPCPMLDNAGRLAEVVEATGAKSTDMEQEEPAADLCAKCTDAAHDWEPVANKLWLNEDDPMSWKRHQPNQGQAESDQKKLVEVGREMKGIQND